MLEKVLHKVTVKGWKTKYARRLTHKATRGPIALLENVLHKVTVKGGRLNTLEFSFTGQRRGP